MLQDNNKKCNTNAAPNHLKQVLYSESQTLDMGDVNTIKPKNWP